MNCLELLRAARSCSGLLGAARSCSELLGAFKVTRGSSELLRAARSCPELLGAARCCSELLGAARSCSELLGAARGCSLGDLCGPATFGGWSRGAGYQRCMGRWIMEVLASAHSELTELLRDAQRCSRTTRPLGYTENQLG